MDSDPHDPADLVLREGIARRRALAGRRARIERSGLFDPDWYRARYPAAAASDLDPLDHYLSRGVAAQADPGPLFDSRNYLAEAWQLEPGVDDPLEHFLQQGLAEGRRLCSTPVSEPADPLGRPVEPFLCRAAPDAPPRIAVSVHAFHPDAFDEICAALARMPVPFSLLVTTDEPEKADSVRASVAAHGLDALLRVHVGPNRGRNFGPMLLAFRSAIAAHELVLHLHTKRSAYRGTVQDGWRRSLLRALLPAGPAISGLLERFRADPALGVLSPALDPALRYWAYNWLSSRHLAQPLFDRLGLRGRVPAGMFDYPVGGMFWARTEAIAPLLAHPWTPDDFPPELHQTDGTVMHAIERVVILMAAERGFTFCEIDYARALLRTNWSARGLEQYARADHGALLDTVAQADTVSFDVFDTLVTRLVLSPDAVHRFIGFACKQRFPGAGDYVALRRAAEALARSERAGTGDVDLDEIHACFGRLAGSGWTAEAIAFVQHEEVALDNRVIRPRAIMVEALDAARRQGRRIILCSDSYLPRRHLDALLRRCGLSGRVDEIYLSSERRARKDRGDLWTLVQDAETRDGTRLLHVGDNPQSDIQSTADRGIRHFHVLDPATLFALRGLEPVFEGGERPLGDEILLGAVAARLCNDPYLGPRFGPVRIDRPEEAGAVLLGPLLLAFAGWIMRHPAVRHLDHVFFVSREGWFLKRIYDALRTAANRRDLPPSRYFHCSRRAALGALQGLGLDPGPVLRGAGYHGTLSEFLLNRIGFEPDPVLGHGAVPVLQPRDDGLICCLMGLMRDPIEAHGRDALRTLRAYAASSGMVPGRAHGFVDVGYSGTMQHALQRMLGVELVGLYMGVSDAAAQVEAGGGHAFGAFARGDVARFTGGYGLMLEAMLTAPDGQTIGYDDSVVPPRPLFRGNGLSQDRFDVLERVYRGAEDYALGLLHAFGPALLDVPVRPEAATAMLEAVRAGRIRLAPSLAAALSVEDCFCGNGEIPVFRQLDDRQQDGLP